MQGYWLSFTDGSKGYCEGESPYDTVQIAQKLSGKTVVAGDNKWEPKLTTLPYPANPIIWQFDHPLSGKCPAFCYRPNQCAGESCCRNNPACTE